MRTLFLSLAVMIGISAVTGCSGTGNNAAAVQMMNNPPNSCGPGGSPDVEDCSNIR